MISSRDARIRLKQRNARSLNTAEAWRKYASILEQTLGVDEVFVPTKTSDNFNSLLEGSVEKEVEKLERLAKISLYKRLITEKLNKSSLDSSWEGIEISNFPRSGLEIATDDYKLTYDGEKPILQTRWRIKEETGMWLNVREDDVNQGQAWIILMEGKDG